MLKKLVIGKWEVNVEEEVKLIPETVLRQLEDFLSNKWREAAMKDIKEVGAWWRGAEKWGIPSPIIRVDMAPSKLFNSQIYEVEVRPAGLGITLTLLTERQSQWREILKDCSCQGFIRLDSSVQDDFLAAKLLDLPYFEGELPPEELKKGSLFWIRTRIDDPWAPILEERSLTPIRMDGYKGYLVKLNLASLVEDPSDLPWERGFVIKPLQGSRMEEVELWLPQKRPGTSTRTRIMKRLKDMSEGRTPPYILQPFIFPEEEEYQGKKGWTIWRPFFGWWKGKYVFIGGLWNWRSNLRIHGASDIIMGPLEERR